MPIQNIPVMLICELTFATRCARFSLPPLPLKILIASYPYHANI